MADVLVIGYVWPEPTSSAAGARMMQLLQFFKSQNLSVTFATTAVQSIYAENLEELGISTEKIALNNKSFDEFLLDCQPKIVLFDRFMMEEQFGWRVSKILPDALKILDTEDLHFLRNFREKQYKNPGLSSLEVKKSDLAKREIASIYRCDFSLIISEVEMKLLETDFQISSHLLLYLPFLFETLPLKEQASLPKFEERRDFVSIGNFRHAPNVDAVLFLKNEIWPLIHKQLPEAKMNVYGAYPSARITQLHDPSINFLVKGRAEDSKQVVKNARISLAPIRFGAGLKGKLTEAMQCGTPSITTLVGAEGISDHVAWSGKIENDPQKFAEAAVALYSNPVKWKEAVENGFKILSLKFDKQLFYKLFCSKIQQVQEILSVHRNENFIGTMLMHHRVKSTHFLSKYIEVKNELEQLKDSLTKTTPKKLIKEVVSNKQIKQKVACKS